MNDEPYGILGVYQHDPNATYVIDAETFFAENLLHLIEHLDIAPKNITIDFHLSWDRGEMTAILIDKQSIRFEVSREMFLGRCTLYEHDLASLIQYLWMAIFRVVRYAVVVWQKMNGINPQHTTLHAGKRLGVPEESIDLLLDQRVKSDDLEGFLEVCDSWIRAWCGFQLVERSNTAEVETPLEQLLDLLRCNGENITAEMLIPPVPFD